MLCVGVISRNRCGPSILANSPDLIRNRPDFYASKINVNNKAIKA